MSLCFSSLFFTHTQEKEKSIFGEGWEGTSLDFQYFPLLKKKRKQLPRAKRETKMRHFFKYKIRD